MEFKTKQQQQLHKQPESPYNNKLSDDSDEEIPPSPTAVKCSRIFVNNSSVKRKCVNVDDSNSDEEIPPSPTAVKSSRILSYKSSAKRKCVNVDLAKEIPSSSTAVKRFRSIPRNSTPQKKCVENTIEAVQHTESPGNYNLSEADLQPSTSRAANLKRKNVSVQKSLLKKPKFNDDETWCDVCESIIPLNRYRVHVRTDAHKDKAAILLKNNIYEIPLRGSKVVKQYRIYSILREEIICKSFLQSVKIYIKELLIERISEYEFIKFNLVLYGTYVKATSEGETLASLKHFPTTFRSARNVIEIDEIIEEFYREMERTASEFQERDSGWAIDHFNYIQTTICKLESIPVGAYIPLPNAINAKGATTNVKNNDIYCFKWCILASIAFIKDNLANSDVKKLTNPNYYHINDISSVKITFRGITLNFSGMAFPAHFHEIKIFEKNNPDISINVYELIKTKLYGKPNFKVIGPARETKTVKPVHINLLTTIENNRYHFVLIRNMQKLVKTQFTRSHVDGEFCDLCQNFYFINSVKHNKECSRKTTTYPKPGTKLSFTRFERKISPPVTVYADLESVLIPVQDTTRGAATTVLQHHKACAVSYFVKHNYDTELTEYYSFEGKFN